MTDDFLFRQYINQGARFLFSNTTYKSKKRMCAPREREMTIQRIYHHGRIFRRGGPPSAAHPSLFSFVFCSMSSKEREVLFEEDSFVSFSLYVLFSLCMWTPELVLFCFCWGSSFLFASEKKKESFSSACVYSTTRAICLAISSNSFFKSGKSEFLRKSQLKSTRAKRERERRERERKRRKRPAIENFSTYSLYKMVAATLAKRAISELFTQQVRAPTVSGSAAEAKRRSIYFFRDICRVSAFSIFSSQSPPSKSLNNGAFGYLCSFVFCVQ